MNAYISFVAEQTFCFWYVHMLARCLHGVYIGMCDSGFFYSIPIQYDGMNCNSIQNQFNARRLEISKIVTWKSRFYGNIWFYDFDRSFCGTFWFKIFSFWTATTNLTSSKLSQNWNQKNLWYLTTILLPTIMLTDWIETFNSQQFCQFNSIQGK